jgi:CRP-like cAMP-binding protein
MVSDNALLAQGLFQMLLAGAALDGAQHPPVSLAGAAAGALVRPVDRALMLREHPLLARATPMQLRALIDAAVEIPITAGTVLVERGDAPALFQVLDGELTVETTAGASCISPGMTIGLAEALSAESASARAMVTRSGRALRVDRDDLFAVLTDHVDLMQGVFSEVLILPRKSLSGMAVQA